VLAEPWGNFTYADEGWRRWLAKCVRELEIDVVICGPLTSAGMEAAGTLQEVRAFLALVAQVRQIAGRDFANLLVHHENKGGTVSGAWEGAGDTLLHAQAHGRGRLQLHVQKARWGSEAHGTKLQLVWAEGDGFAVGESNEITDEQVAEQIIDAVRAKPGTGWTRVEKATQGISRERRNGIRDGLLAAGQIVNLQGKKGEPKVLVRHVEEAKAAHLYLPDDPELTRLLRGLGAVGEQTAPAHGGDGEIATAPCSLPIRGEQGEQEQLIPPVPDSQEQSSEGAT
jgi:hypothetical protein